MNKLVVTKCVPTKKQWLSCEQYPRDPSAVRLLSSAFLTLLDTVSIPMLAAADSRGPSAFPSILDSALTGHSIALGNGLIL